VRRRLFGVAGNQRRARYRQGRSAGVAHRRHQAAGIGRGGAQPLGKYRHLTPHDEIKFVLADRADYEWAREIIQARSLARVCPILFSPVQGELPPAQLADWILADRLPVRLQVQLHKVLWGNAPGK